MTKIQELRDLSTDELQTILIETRKEVFKLSQKNRLSSKERKIHLIGITRKKIARILTILRQKATIHKS